MDGQKKYTRSPNTEHCKKEFTKNGLRRKKTTNSGNPLSFQL
jgi:hypothetical protein